MDPAETNVWCAGNNALEADEANAAALTLNLNPREAPGVTTQPAVSTAAAALSGAASACVAEGKSATDVNSRIIPRGADGGIW